MATTFTILYIVTLQYDGIVRQYHCETYRDSAVLFNALYRGAKWHALTVICCRTDRVIQCIIA